MAAFCRSFSSVLILALGGMSRAVVWIPLISGAPFFGLPGSSGGLFFESKGYVFWLLTLMFLVVPDDEMK